jgi:hypothetical protein
MACLRARKHIQRKSIILVLSAGMPASPTRLTKAAIRFVRLACRDPGRMAKPLRHSHVAGKKDRARGKTPLLAMLVKASDVREKGPFDLALSGVHRHKKRVVEEEENDPQTSEVWGQGYEAKCMCGWRKVYKNPPHG